MTSGDSPYFHGESPYESSHHKANENTADIVSYCFGPLHNLSEKCIFFIRKIQPFSYRTLPFGKTFLQSRQAISQPDVSGVYYFTRLSSAQMPYPTTKRAHPIRCALMYCFLCIVYTVSYCVCLQCFPFIFWAETIRL